VEMPKTIDSIKEHLDENLGNEIKVVAQTGRKKTTERKGILSDTYPAVFVVELDQEDNSFERVSYSYTDVLTDSVDVQFK